MQEKVERYGLTEDQWKEYNNKFGEELLAGLIRALAPDFRRKFYRRRLVKDSEIVTIPVERGLGQTTVGVQVDGRELELLARAGKKMDDIIEGRGRGIVKRMREEN